MKPPRWQSKWQSPTLGRTRLGKEEVGKKNNTEKEKTGRKTQDFPP
jgi:hypothetical protein